MTRGPTLRDEIMEAVRSDDAKECGRIATYLRGCGFNYNRTYRMVSNITGISWARWDELLYEADNIKETR